MPKPSFTQKLSNKPSRSYLSSSALSDIELEGRSVVSYRSGGGESANSYGGDYPGPSSPRGSINGDPRRFSTLPPSRTLSSILRGSKTASSDAGLPYSSSALRVRDASLGGSSNPNRRSVTFSDAGPSYDDDRTNERMAVMSDMGLPYGGHGRKRTPSITSSIMSDNFSDSGSVSTRRSVRRGTKSERVVAPQSLNLWHNDLGGPGFVKRSPSSGTVKSTSSNPLNSIIKRKSSNTDNRMSPGRLMDLANATPSRRYASPPPSATVPLPSESDTYHTAPAESTSKSDTLAVPVSMAQAVAMSNNGSSSGGSSPATSEVSFSMRTMHHSRHTQKQRADSNLEPLSVASPPDAATPEDVNTSVEANEETKVVKRPKGVSRSSSTSSSASKKSKSSSKGSATVGVSTTTAQAPPSTLHASTLRNELLSAPPTRLNKSKVSTA